MRNRKLLHLHYLLKAFPFLLEMDSVSLLNRKITHVNVLNRIMNHFEIENFPFLIKKIKKNILISIVIRVFLFLIELEKFLFHNTCV